jgi:Zn-dependent peptidase ImmA (M78 family)
MHELSHRTLEHGAKKVDASTEGIMLLSSYDKKQEDEADWLAGCLLLPRDALVRIRKENVELPDAARLYGVSLRMLNYRMAMTGVNRQFSAPKSRKSV